MKGLEQLKKKRRPDLVTMAEKLSLKIHSGLNRTEIAKRILKKQKLIELEEPEPKKDVLDPKLEKSKIKPEFETLASESIESEPGLPQGEKDGPGGFREGAGRTPGLTDEKARVQRILKNQVPDPVVQFVIESIFGLVGEPKKKTVEPTPDMIAIPATNLISYYFPNLHATPVLQVWFELGIGIKNLVMSNLEMRKAKPDDDELEPGPKESDNNGK